MKKIIIFIFATFSSCSYAQPGFVKLPDSSDTPSAYILCNSTGNYGFSNSQPPSKNENNDCAIIRDELNTSALVSPIPDFKLVGVLVSDVVMPPPHAGDNNAVAVLSEAIWRNKNNTECILGTHIEMKNSPLSNGDYWEINDISRGGFSGKDVSIAYFYKPHSQDEGGNTEVLFRAGRTFTSVKTSPNELSLPFTENPPHPAQEFNENNFASFSENWVTFTTDLSFKDTDISTRAISSILYIKYDCDNQDPIKKDNAIYLRSTNNSLGKNIAISAPGLIPINSSVDLY